MPKITFIEHNGTPHTVSVAIEQNLVMCRRRWKITFLASTLTAAANAACATCHVCMSNRNGFTKTGLFRSPAHSGSQHVEFSLP